MRHQQKLRSAKDLCCWSRASHLTPLRLCLLVLVLLSCLQVEQVVPFSPDCTMRVMRLSSAASDASHMLCHYHFHAWPDHGTPGSSAGLRAVCRSLSTARESGAPVLVHCSAVSRDHLMVIGLLRMCWLAVVEFGAVALCWRTTKAQQHQQQTPRKHRCSYSSKQRNKQRNTRSLGVGVCVAMHTAAPLAVHCARVWRVRAGALQRGEQEMMGLP
jgi:hypothetical protein